MGHAENASDTFWAFEKCLLLSPSKRNYGDDGNVSPSIIEELKTLEKIHCETYELTYDKCEKCEFHKTINRLMEKCH